LEELVNEESKENGERRKEMKREVNPQSTKYFHFVSIWLPSWIVMTDQSPSISRADRSAILVMALFYSRPL
jgi:hypothetical protein